MAVKMQGQKKWFQKLPIRWSWPTPTRATPWNYNHYVTESLIGSLEKLEKWILVTFIQLDWCRQNLKIRISYEVKNKYFISLVFAKYNLTLTGFLYVSIHMLRKVFYQFRLDILDIGAQHLYIRCHILLGWQMQTKTWESKATKLRNIYNNIAKSQHQFHSSLLWQPFWKLELMIG